MWAMMCDLWCSNSVEREQSAEGVEATQRDVHPFRKCLQGDFPPSSRFADRVPEQRSVGNTCIIFIIFRAIEKSVICNLKLS
ncbi:hypothetical protein CDAR_212391 [Caerostris darwini]|uniref:Uncharacterized protein n=1 Tax=Caerostris darwini TaxID=1538125 RepID=A0AAV4SBI8_9ARAC|nr:hypothetical protein CDAR_212391 [Caerostris darwini]